MTQAADDILGDNQLICALTKQPKKADNKENTLQSIIAMLNEEYGFELEDMERDYSVTVDDGDKKRKSKVNLAVFEPQKPHKDENLIRICIVQDEKVKVVDTKKGVEATLGKILFGTDCEFGLWTNGEDLLFQHRIEDDYG